MDEGSLHVSVLVTVPPILFPLDLATSIPRQAFFAFDSCSLPEYLRLKGISFSSEICFMKLGFRLDFVM